MTCNASHVYEELLRVYTEPESPQISARNPERLPMTVAGIRLGRPFLRLCRIWNRYDLPAICIRDLKQCRIPRELAAQVCTIQAEHSRYCTGRY